MSHKHLLELAMARPKTVQFPLRRPNVSLRSRAVSRCPIMSPPVDFPRTRGNFHERILLIGFPLVPDDLPVELDQGVLDQLTYLARQLFQQRIIDEQEIPLDVEVQRCVFCRIRAAVPWGRVAFLALCLFTSISIEELLDLLRPYVIRYARSIALSVWERWGDVIAITAAQTYVPRLTSAAVGLIPHLPPHWVTLLRPDYIALLPPSYVETLPPYYIETLPRSYIESLSPSCIESLSPSCIESLSASCLMRLSPLCRETLALDLGTETQMQLIHIHQIVDRFSTMLIAPVLPCIPVPVVTYATRFSVALGFWSLTFSLWRLVRGGVFFGEIPAAEVLEKHSLTLSTTELIVDRTDIAY